MLAVSAAVVAMAAATEMARWILGGSACYWPIISLELNSLAAREVF